MSGDNETKQTTKSQSDPWAPAVPYLENNLQQIGRQFANVGLTGTEKNAFSGLTSNAQNGNPYAPQIGMLANDFLSGGPDRTGILSSAYGDYQTGIAPTARGDFVDPTKNPYVQNVASTVGNDIQNRINSMFAGSGRDLSGINQQAVARGVMEGTAPIYMDAYNTERGRQLGALDSSFNAGASTASGLSALDNASLATRAQGINVADSALTAKDAPYQRLLEIEAQKRGIPLQNLGMLANMLVPFGNLGRTSTGETTTTESRDPTGAIIGATLGGLSLLGGNPMGLLGMGSGLGMLGGWGGMNRGSAGGTGGILGGFY